MLYPNIKIQIYRTIIRPVVLYGNETWSLTLRNECRGSGFSINRILKRILETNRAEDKRWLENMISSDQIEEVALCGGIWH